MDPSAHEPEVDATRLSAEEEQLRRASVALRCLSPDCLLHLLRAPEAGHLEDLQLRPGEAFQSEEDSLVLFVSGFVQLPCGQTLRAPAALGEAAFLGLADLPPSSSGSRDGGGGEAEERKGFAAEALEACNAKVLRREAFEEVLRLYPEDRKVLDRLSREAAHLVAPGSRLAVRQESSGRRLLSFLKAGPLFENFDESFLAELWASAKGLLLGPEDRLIERGTRAALGESPLFLVLAGQLQVEGESGVLLRLAGPGEVLGAAALGGAETWPETIRAAAGRRPAYVARLSGQALSAVLRRNPEESMRLQESAVTVVESEEATALQRSQWLREVAVPALAGTTLLAGCPEDFLESIAGALSEAAYEEGDCIATFGDAADSMLVVLEGSVDLEAKSGTKIGRLGPGALMGELEALGLLPSRTVSAYAATPCRVLAVGAEALNHALSAPGARPLQEGFRQLVEGRKAQVAAAQPLSSLISSRSPLKEDVGCQLLSLRAERLPLEPGVRWEPTRDSDASGPQLSLVMRGRVAVELSEDRAEDVLVKAGSVVPEGLLAAYGACLRATSSDCEVYRLRQFDLLTAAHSNGQAPDWFYQLRVKEQEARNFLQARLANAKGLAQGRAHRPVDDHIRGWAEKRKKSMRKAQEQQAYRAENYLGSKLPLLPPKSLGTTAFRSWPEERLAKQSSEGYPQGQGPEAFKALRGLTKARSSPQLAWLPPCWPNKLKAASTKAASKSRAAAPLPPLTESRGRLTSL
eukprot:TRINITY_DN41764_c0_g1_i1.p1 TRINITY_DN41764_c0_g1~~TRINITY_DN41764_c0_g1_i1.p1  ORF type:complete len:750 (+),score=166.33 TRINITY_DN41764_c0_g1_i1:71-2320(+)